MWISISSIGKISDGCIKDLEFNSHLYQKLIGILVMIMPATFATSRPVTFVTSLQYCVLKFQFSYVFGERERERECVYHVYIKHIKLSIMPATHVLERECTMYALNTLNS